MSFLPTFAAWHFAVAGLACAALPVVIHLLNRRRFRVVQWAAMDFLREAMKRNRRILQIRDLLLLALRTLAVLLFGLALARPYFSSRDEAFDGSQPLHAILLVDNSLSMGYQSLRGTALDEAKERARELIDKLPRGSRISVIPICGSAHPISLDPYETAESALEALARIETVDRAASLQRALNEARRAVSLAPEIAGVRVVVIGDQQRNNWSDVALDKQALAGLPSIQVVDVGPETWDNAWISDLRIQDGVADVDTPATLLVDVQYRGAEPRRDLEVKLLVDGKEVAAKVVTVTAGEGAQQVAFEYVFGAYQPEPGQQQFVPVTATLQGDNLPADDERHLMVPVVAALPVVFVDQFSDEQEDPLQNRLGETRQLRKLLAPVVSRQDVGRHLVRIRHVTIDDLTQEILADARLVVIAGIAAPGPEQVRLLREYVVQGGQLFLAAGASFEPGPWNSAAWLDGAGILPAPLKQQPLGSLPEEAGERLKPFSISYESLANDTAFRLTDTAEEDLRDLYGEPFFFKAVEAELGRETLDSLRTTLREQLAEEERLVGELQNAENESAKRAARGEQDVADSGTIRERQARLRELRPNWLRWSKLRADDDAAVTSASQDDGDQARNDEKRLAVAVERSLPRVLARFTSEEGPAFLVERRVGDGRVLMATSGMLSSWNTLHKTNTMFLMDRLLRGMINETVPARNFGERPRIVVPLPSTDGLVAATLKRPAQLGLPESLDIGFITRDQKGVAISQPLARGLYRVSVQGEENSPPAAASAGDDKNGAEGSKSDAAATPTLEVTLAVNGTAEESDLSRVSRERFDTLAADSPLHWVGRGEEISLAGSQVRGQDSWWYMVALVLVILLVEIALLAWPAWRGTA